MASQMRRTDADQRSRGFPATTGRLVAFFVLTFVLSWVILPFTRALNPTGPLLAALVLSAMAGRADLHAWLRRSFTLRGPGRWYLYAVLVIVGMNVAAVALALLLGMPVPARDQLRASPELLIEFLVYLLIIGVPEESGWRGYAMPALEARLGTLRASFVLGVIIALWHVPLVLLGDQVPVILVAVVASQFVFTWLQRRTNGSVPVVMVAHAAQGGLAGAYFGPMLTGRDETLEQAMLAVVVTVAAVAMSVAGQRRAASRAAPPSPVPPAVAGGTG